MRQVRAAVLLIASATLSACSAGSDSGSRPTSGSAPISDSPSSQPVASDPDLFDPQPEAGTEPAVEAFADGPLGEVCPDRITVQTPGLPEVAQGPLYALLDSAPTRDANTQRASAPLVRPDGTVEDVTIEIRAGGPAVGFRSPNALLAEDPDISLALTSLSGAVAERDVFQTVGVAGLTRRSATGVIFDPATYPAVSTFEDLAGLGVEVHHVTDAPIASFLVSAGRLTAEQTVPGFDGEPATFVTADGAVAQIGDATVDVALLESLPQWGRPVGIVAAADAGWNDVDELLVTQLSDASDGRLSDECLGRFVRIVQRSIASFAAEPSATIALMAELRSTYNPLNRISADLMLEGHADAIATGVFDPTSSDVAGSVTDAVGSESLDAFLAALTGALGRELLVSDDVVTDRYLDPTVTSAG